MRLLIATLSITIFAVLIPSCKNDKPIEIIDESNSLKVTVQPVFGAQTLYLDSTYTTVEGYDVQFTDIKFYAENIRNGSSVLHDAALFDYRTTGITLFDLKGEPEDFASLQANLGVDAAINHNDPTAFANASMLNIANANDMHWGWNPGYIFVKIEAKVDTIQDGNPLFDHSVVFHVGADVNLQTLSYSAINWQALGAGKHFFPLKLDMAGFLQNGAQSIDLKNEFSSHTAPGQEVLSLKVMTNFKAAITEY